MDEQKDQRDHQPNDRKGEREAGEDRLHGAGTTINQGSGFRGQGSVWATENGSYRPLLFRNCEAISSRFSPEMSSYRLPVSEKVVFYSCPVFVYLVLYSCSLSVNRLQILHQQKRSIGGKKSETGV